jgi:hypothetical protein
MRETKTVLDHEHPCLACGEAWLVQLQMRAHPHAFIVWKQRGIGQCSARCMTRDKDAYNRGLQERRQRGWTPARHPAMTSGASRFAGVDLDASRMISA